MYGLYSGPMPVLNSSAVFYRYLMKYGVQYWRTGGRIEEFRSWFDTSYTKHVVGIFHDETEKQ